MDLDHMTKQDVLSDDVLTELFSQEDEIEKARMMIALQDRASELGVGQKFRTLVAAYKKVDVETRKKKGHSMSLLENWTNFSGPYNRMQCRSWVASDDGVYSYNTQSGNLDVLACYHPILPVERLKNLETGEEQIKLAYKRNGRWSEIIVPKTIVTSANKIVSLSARGVAVTSENAKQLVRYLADVENANDDAIGIQYSSSKLGWIGEGFLPYNNDIVFDGDSRFRQIFDSIGEHGSREKWYSHVKKLRASGRIEVKFLLAASFASVLLKLLGGLPFFVDLWGETEGGKTVTLMLATSVWADPSDSRYMGDFKTTDVALEARADMLNNLPMVLDDTSKTSARIRDNFEGIVYDLCSGKGKSRSNKELGLNRENRWKNCILTNGERPLSSYVNQGGAINRILEIECGERVYQNPQETAELLKNNYGFAGRDFIDVLTNIDIEALRGIQREFMTQLANDEKMQKQSLSLSIILTADKIATDRLFMDRQSISISEAKECLIERNELSDNERCYRYLVDKINMNQQRFDDETKIEKWGVMQDEYAVIYNAAFDELCKSGGFSKKSFLSWAGKKELILPQGDQLTRVKKINGKTFRCIFLRLEELGQDAAADGFLPVPEQIDLVFD